MMLKYLDCYNFVKQTFKECEQDREIHKASNVKEIAYLEVNIIVRQGNIIDQPVDAIVNPANEELNNAGGAAKAIQEGGGDEVLRECEEFINTHPGGLKEGSVHCTTAGDLPCKYIFHTVGPRYIKSSNPLI